MHLNICSTKRLGPHQRRATRAARKKAENWSFFKGGSRGASQGKSASDTPPRGGQKGWVRDGFGVPSGWVGGGFRAVRGRSVASPGRAGERSPNDTRRLRRVWGF